VANNKNRTGSNGRKSLLTPAVLSEQNEAFRGSGGVSEENRSRDFRPAFLDRETGNVYLSRFADGRPAPMHLLDGLPDEVVVARQSSGSVHSIKPTVIAGFLWCQKFFTRDQVSGIIWQYPQQSPS
jgi:hypothetical protein